jgi:4-aminobutyrate aminotransferase / (S)-3-amino-2-methylpropionate transaminase
VTMASLLRSGLRRKPTIRAAITCTFSTSWNRPAASFPDEPKTPVVKTAIPGPKNKAAAAELDEFFDTQGINLLADYEKSIGN